MPTGSIPQYGFLYFMAFNHCVGTLGLIISIFFWSKYITNLRAEKKKATYGDILVLCWFCSMLLNEVAYVFPMLGANYDRSLFTTTGLIGGPPTPLCTATAAMVNYFSNSLCIYTTCVLVNVYLSVVIQAKPDTLQKAFYFYHTWAFVIPLALTIVMFLTADIGPLSMW
jgi:hypothetical protein